MHDTQLVMYDEDYRKVLAVVERLVRDANAKGVFVVDRNGQLIAEAGEMRGIDTTSLASLTAGSVAATGGLAKIVGEEEFPVHFHQGQHDNLHVTLVGGRVILVVIFDDRSSLGLVRLRVKKASVELARVFSSTHVDSLSTQLLEALEAMVTQRQPFPGLGITWQLLAFENGSCSSCPYRRLLIYDLVKYEHEIDDRPLVILSKILLCPVQDGRHFFFFRQGVHQIAKK